MNLHRLWVAPLLLLLSISVAPLAAAPDTDAPAKVVQDLLHSSMIHFGFGPDTVKAAKPWVALELYDRMVKKANTPTPKGDAPDIEGDLFLDCQDAPTSYKVGDAIIADTKAKVPVTLTWDSEKRHLTFLLEQVDGAWKVYDVIYDKDGKLTDLL